MTDNVIRSNAFIERPNEKALISAIDDVIHEIAVDVMTPAEVLGCLDVVSKNLYSRCFEGE